MHEKHAEYGELFHRDNGRWKTNEYAQNQASHMAIADAKKLQLIPASSFTASGIDWIYTDLMAKGELTAIFGAPDVGKSTLLCRFVAGVTTGEANDQSEGLKPNCRGNVVILDIENSIEKTLLPRLKAAGANLEKVHFIGKNTENNEQENFSFCNHKHIARLEVHCRHLGDVAIIVVDPIYAAVKSDANNDAQARRAYENLAALAKRLNCAIVGIAHSVKNPREKFPLLSRMGGPRALQQVPRIILMVVAISGQENGIHAEKVMVIAKNNLSRGDAGIAFVIEEVEIGTPTAPMNATRARVTRIIHGRAEEIINSAERSDSGEKVRKGDAAIDFLVEVLASGPQLKNDIMSLAETAGIKFGTLHKAKSDLKIVTKKRKGDGLSEWSLPA